MEKNTFQGEVKWKVQNAIDDFFFFWESYEAEHD